LETGEENFDGEGPPDEHAKDDILRAIEFLGLDIEGKKCTI
jgi:hypothetical protein